MKKINFKATTVGNRGSQIVPVKMSHLPKAASALGYKGQKASTYWNYRKTKLASK